MAAITVTGTDTATVTDSAAETAPPLADDCIDLIMSKSHAYG